MHSRDIPGLMPLEKQPLQVYFSDSIQLAQVIDWVVSQTGPADVVISTFSTSEEFIRRLWRLKKQGMILSCRMFCDLRAARKTISLARFMESVFDTVAMCQNHSKVVLLSNATRSVAIVTSQNQTRGDRYECGVITTDTPTVNKLRLGFDALARKSLPLEHLIKNQ